MISSQQPIINLQKNQKILRKKTQTQINQPVVDTYIRIRPILNSELELPIQHFVIKNMKSISLLKQIDLATQKNKSNNQNKFQRNKSIYQQITGQEFKFKGILPPQITQKQLFDNNIGKSLEQVINYQKKSVTIMAYGLTGSGKTYTMFGKLKQDLKQGKNQQQQSNQSQQQLQPQQNVGISLRIIKYIFNNKQFTQNYTIYCSHLQVYNQKIFDLFVDNNHSKMRPLEIHQKKQSGIFVQGLSQYQISNYKQCSQLLFHSRKNHLVRSTINNPESSRSHTLFQIIFQQNSTTNINPQKFKINICDLAGSQKQPKRQILNQQHLKQLKNINQSLTTLGKVISSLVNNNNSIASFRESKLTRLLQQSLTSNTHIIIIGTISQKMYQKDQTLNTLRFIQKMGKVKVRNINKNIRRNINKQDYQGLVQQLKQQIERLKKQVLINNDTDKNLKLYEQLVQQNNKLRKLKQEAVKTKSIQKQISPHTPQNPFKKPRQNQNIFPPHFKKNINKIQQNQSNKSQQVPLQNKQSNTNDSKDQYNNLQQKQIEINIYPVDLRSKTTHRKYEHAINNQSKIHIQQFSQNQNINYKNIQKPKKNIPKIQVKTTPIQQSIHKRSKSSDITQKKKISSDIAKQQKITQTQISYQIQSIQIKKPNHSKISDSFGNQPDRFVNSIKKKQLKLPILNKKTRKQERDRLKYQILTKLSFLENLQVQNSDKLLKQLQQLQQQQKDQQQLKKDVKLRYRKDKMQRYQSKERTRTENTKYDEYKIQISDISKTRRRLESQSQHDQNGRSEVYKLTKPKNEEIMKKYNKMSIDSGLKNYENKRVFEKKIRDLQRRLLKNGGKY